MKFKTFVDPSMVIITIYYMYIQFTVCLINFPLFIPKIISPWDRSQEIYNFSSPYIICLYQFLLFIPQRCYIPNLVKICPMVLEKKISPDDGRQTLAIGHLGDSDYLSCTSNLSNKLIFNRIKLHIQFQLQHIEI